MGEYGFGFSSKLASEQTSLLAPIYYTNQRFILTYFDKENKIVFEIEW
jgi:hypothetical protein